MELAALTLADASCLYCGDEAGGRGSPQAGKYGARHLSLAVCVPSPASPPAGNTSPLCEQSRARTHKHDLRQRHDSQFTFSARRAS